LIKSFLRFSKIHLVLGRPVDAVFGITLVTMPTCIHIGTRTPIRSTRSPTLKSGMAAHPIPGGLQQSIVHAALVFATADFKEINRAAENNSMMHVIDEHLLDLAANRSAR
jgi:hypothetical protein